MTSLAPWSSRQTRKRGSKHCQLDSLAQRQPLLQRRLCSSSSLLSIVRGLQLLLSAEAARILPTRSNGKSQRNERVQQTRPRWQKSLPMEKLSSMSSRMESAKSQPFHPSLWMNQSYGKRRKRLDSGEMMMNKVKYRLAICFKQASKQSTLNWMRLRLSDQRDTGVVRCSCLPWHATSARTTATDGN
jgi:hypothetical protein